MKTKALIFAAAIGIASISATSFAETPKIVQKTEQAAEKTGDYMSDSALTAKVKTALLAEKDLKSLGISVKSTDGVVTLSGKVPSEESVSHAGTVVKNLHGVKDVHNELEVKAKM